MKVKKFKLSLGNAIGGGDLSVVGYKFTNGTGPKTYIQGGTHGGEITYPIFQKIYKYLEKNKFKGTVTLVPISNPLSWTSRLYFYTAGKFSMYDGKDWNWFFPGKEDGTTAQRFAHMVFSEAKNHDFVIDVHTSRWSRPFLIIGEDKYLPMAKEMGISHTFLMDLQKAAKAKGVMPLSGAIDEVGIDGFTIECGSHDSMDFDVFDYCANCILKTLSLRGHMEFNTTQESEYYYTGLKTYNAPDTGFVEYKKEFWEEVKKGDILYKLYPSNNLKKVINVKAEEDSVMAKHQPTHTAIIGDQVVQVIPKNKIKKF